MPPSDRSDTMGVMTQSGGVLAEGLFCSRLCWASQPHSRVVVAVKGGGRNRRSGTANYHGRDLVMETSGNRPGPSPRSRWLAVVEALDQAGSTAFPQGRGVWIRCRAAAAGGVVLHRARRPSHDRRRAAAFGPLHPIRVAFGDYRLPLWSRPPSSASSPRKPSSWPSPAAGSTCPASTLTSPHFWPGPGGSPSHPRFSSSTPPPCSENPPGPPLHDAQAWVVERHPK